MYGHFYDNNRGNQDWHHLCPHIQFHKVQDNPNFDRGDSDALRVLLETESEDVQRVYKMYTEHFSDTFFDPRSGNQLDTGESMFEHVKNSSVKAVIFDWDRTLQQFECMSTNSFESWCQKFGAETDERKEDFALALAIYHAGGTQRFNVLKDMFSTLKQQKKIVYIITGNPAVTTVGKELYIRILNKWGLNHFSLAYAINKYHFMANDPILCCRITW
jgi:hypothetical protein